MLPSVRFPKLPHLMKHILFLQLPQVGSSCQGRAEAAYSPARTVQRRLPWSGKRCLHGFTLSAHSGYRTQHAEACDDFRVPQRHSKEC